MSEDIMIVIGLVFQCSMIIEQIFTMRREAFSLALINNGICKN